MTKKARRTNVAITLTILCVIAIATIAIIHFTQTASIPTVLNYDGSAWIDQNGEIMSAEEAENFLNNSPEYAREIFYLNSNPYYAVALQNEARTAIIKELREKCISKNGEGLYYDRNRNTSTCVDALQDLINTPPTDSAFSKLLVHLQNNGARDDVIDLLNLCHAGEVKSRSARDMARYLFFGTLAKNYDSKYIDEVCGMPVMGATSPQIPVILLADRMTWLDQNGNVMDQKQARIFLIANKEYAGDIIHYNSNPYYLPWRADLDDDFIDYFWEDLCLARFEENENATKCTWVVEDILNNPPSLEILINYRNRLRLIKNGATQYLSELINYIESDGDGSTLQHHTSAYIFWNAVAKATENGTIEFTSIN